MKKIIICLILLFNQHLLMGQIVPYLWNEHLQLKKETVEWIEKTTHVTEIDEGKKVDFPLSKIEIGKEGKRIVTLYDKSGKIRAVNVGYFESEFIEIYETEEGDKELKKYDENGNLIYETWMYPDGSKDEKFLTYKNNKLIKIVEKDDFYTATEVFKYNDGQLSQILSIDKNRAVLMERKILYDSDGKIKETQRIQEGEINKRTLYSYNEENRLVLKEESTINRLTGRRMPPEIYEYTYYKNGLVKEEKWIIYKDERKEDIQYLSISVFNEFGLEIKETLKNYMKDLEKITIYEYKMKE